MSARAASPRILLLACVAALHALVLLLLTTGTRARLVPGMTDVVAPLIVLLLEPHERPPAPAGDRAPRAHSPRTSASVPTAPPPKAPSVPAPPETGTAIDWAAEASASANEQLAADALHARQASALAPPKSALFAAQAKRHGFQWDYARTHREGVPGIATVIHLGDRCAIAFFLIIPVAGGCAVEKPQVRGDLFDHMHDPQP